MPNFPSSVSSELDLLIPKNNVFLTLGANVGAGDAVIPVDDTSSLPASGVLTFEDDTFEIIHYSGKTPTSLTGVTRGYDGTGASAHNGGVTLGMWWVAKYHTLLAQEIVALETNIANRLGLDANRILFQSGSGSLSPAVSVNGEATGLFGGSGVLGIATSGGEAAHFDSAGLTISQGRKIGVGNQAGLRSNGYSPTPSEAISIGHGLGFTSYGVLELVGMKTGANVPVGSIGFLNKAIGSADDRIADISATLLDGDHIGRLLYTVWNGATRTYYAMTPDYFAPLTPKNLGDAAAPWGTVYANTLSLSGGFNISNVLLDDGDAANPSLTFALDQNLGLLRVSNDTMGIATGGILRAVFSNSGYFGLGTATPASLMEARTDLNNGVNTLLTLSNLGQSTSGAAGVALGFDIASDNSATRLVRAGAISRDAAGTMSITNKATANPGVAAAHALRIIQEGSNPIEFYTGGVLRSSISGFSPVWKIFGNEPIHAEGAQPVVTLKDTATNRTVSYLSDNGKLILRGGTGGNDLTINYDGTVQTAGQIFATTGIIPVLPNQSLGNSGQKWNDAFFATAHIDTLVLTGGAVTALFVQGENPLDGDVVLIPGTGITMTQTDLAKTIQIDNDGLLSLGLYMGGAGLKGAVTLEAGDNITLTQNGPGNRIKIDAAGAATMTWPLLAPNGTVSAPSYSFENLPTWGWYADPSENSVELAVDGADYLKARKYASGVRLALGGHDPVYSLDVLYQSDQVEEEAEMFRLANYRQSTGYQFNGIMMSFDIALNNSGSRGQVARIDRFFDGQFRILNSAGQFHSSHTKNALTSFEGTEGVARIGINTGNHWISINDQGFIGLDGTPPSAPAGTNLATPQSLLQFGKVSGTHASMIEILGSGAGTYGVLAFTNGTKSKARIEAVDQGNYGDLRFFFGTGASTEASLGILGTSLFPEILPSVTDTFELGTSANRFRSFYGVRSLVDYSFAKSFLELGTPGVYYVRHQANQAMQAQTTYTWGPDGTSGQVLTTDGSGNLSWGALQISYPLIAPNGTVSAPQFGFNTYEGGKTGFFYDPSNTNPHLGLMYGDSLYNQEIAEFSSHQAGESMFVLKNGVAALTVKMDTSNVANISVPTGKTMKISGANSILEFKDNYIDFTGLAIRPAGNGALGDAAHWFGQVYGGTVNTQNLTMYNSGKTKSMQWTYTGAIDSDPYLWPALGNVGQVLRRGSGLNGPLEWADVGGSGTVNAGTANQIAFYSANGAAVSSSQYITIEGGGVVNFPSGFRISNQQPIYLNYGGGTVYPKMTYSAAASALFFATMNSNSDKSAYLASEGAIHLYANVNQDGTGAFRPHLGLYADGHAVIDSAFTAPSVNQYLQLQFVQGYTNNTYFPTMKMIADAEFLTMGYVADGSARKAARIASSFGPLELTGATSVKIQGSLWPTTVGVNGQMLKTDGAGQLSWANVATVNAGTSPNPAYYSSTNSVDVFDGMYFDTVGKWVSFPYNGIRTHNGTASAPTHGFFNQFNKGMYSPATDYLGWSTVGVYRMYLDASGNLGLRDGKQFRLHDDDDSNYIALVAPAGVLTSDYVYTLPANYGTSGQFLQTNGAGILSWATVSGGGGGSGTVNPGNAGSFAYYPANGTTVDDSAILTTDGSFLTATVPMLMSRGTSSPGYSFAGATNSGLDYQDAGGPFPARMGLAFAGVQKMWFTSADILLKDSTKMWLEAANDGPSIKFGVDYAGAGISGGRSPDELKFWIGQTPVNVGGVDYMGVYGNYLGMRHTNGFQTRIKTAAITADKTFTWPAGYGSANQMLTTDGAGNLSWQAAGGTSGTIVPAVTPWTMAIYSNTSEISNLENIMGWSSNFWVKSDMYFYPNFKVQYGAVGNYIWRNQTTSKMEIKSSDGLKIQSVFFPAGDGTSGQALVTDGAGNLSFATVGGASGANAALSNLASVAINTALLPDTSNTKDIGSQTKSFRNIFGTGLTTNALAFRAAGAGSAIAPAIDYDGNATGLFWNNNELHYTKDGTDMGELGAGGASLSGSNYFSGWNQFAQPIVIAAEGLGAFSAQLFVGEYGGGGWINMLWQIPVGNNWIYTVPDVGSDAAFMMTKGAQTVDGSKTFHDAMYFRPAGSSDSRTIIRPSRIDLWYHEQTFIYSGGNNIGFSGGAATLLNLDPNGLSFYKKLIAGAAGLDIGSSASKFGSAFFSGTVNVGAYTLPNTDGTAGQVLQTDGSGVLTWQSVGGGVTYPLLAPMNSTVNFGFAGTTPIGFSSYGEGGIQLGSAGHIAIDIGNLNLGGVQIVFTTEVEWTSFDSSGDLQNPSVYFGPTGEVGLYITDAGHTLNFSGYKAGPNQFVNVLSLNGEKTKVHNQLHVNSVSAAGIPPVLLGPTGILGIGIVETANPKGSLQYTADSGATYDDALTWGASGIHVLGVLTTQAGIMPSNHGSSGQVLTTDGAGNLSWQNAAGGVTFPLAVPVDGTIAQLTFGSRGDTGFYDQGTKLVFTHNGEMAFEASYDGYFSFRDFTVPTNAGSAGQVLTSNGSGGTSWQTPASGGSGTVEVGASGTFAAYANDTAVVSSGPLYYSGADIGMIIGQNFEFTLNGAMGQNLAGFWADDNHAIRFYVDNADQFVIGSTAIIANIPLSIKDGEKLYFSYGQADPQATAFLYYDSVNSYLKGQTWLAGTDQSFDLWSDGEIGLYNATGTAIAILANGDITIASVTSRVKINNQYHLPTVDGTAGQVVVTDGAGNLSWANAGGGGGVTFPLLAPAGSETAPSYSFTGLAGSGLFVNANGWPSISEDGVEVMYFAQEYAISKVPLIVQYNGHPNDGCVALGQHSGVMFWTAVSGGGQWQDTFIVGTMSANDSNVVERLRVDRDGVTITANGSVLAYLVDGEVSIERGVFSLYGDGSITAPVLNFGTGSGLYAGLDGNNQKYIAVTMMDATATNNAEVMRFSYDKVNVTDAQLILANDYSAAIAFAGHETLGFAWFDGNDSEDPGWAFSNDGTRCVALTGNGIQLTNGCYIQANANGPIMYLGHTAGGNTVGNIEVLADGDALSFEITIAAPTASSLFKADTTGFQINGAYKLPAVDGTSGYVLTTNGAGVVSWQAAGGGGGIPFSGNYWTLEYDPQADDRIGLRVSNPHVYNGGDAGLLGVNIDFNLEEGQSTMMWRTADGAFQIHNNATTMYGDPLRKIILNQNFADLADGPEILHRIGGENRLITGYDGIIVYDNTTTEKLRADHTGVMINRAYILPLADGASGKVLGTTGAGVELVWVDAPTPSFIGAPTPESYLYNANGLPVLTMDGTEVDYQGSGNPGTFVQLDTWAQLRIPGSFNGQGSRIPFAFDDGMGNWNNGFSYYDSGNGASLNIIRDGNSRIQVFSNYVLIDTIGDPNGGAMAMGANIYSPTIYNATMSDVKTLSFDANNLNGVYFRGNYVYLDGDGNNYIRGNMPSDSWQGVMVGSGSTDAFLFDMNNNQLRMKQQAKLTWVNDMASTEGSFITDAGSGIILATAGMGFHWQLGINNSFEVMYISDNKELKFGDQSQMTQNSQWEFNYDAGGDVLSFLTVNALQMAQIDQTACGVGIQFALQANGAATITRTLDGVMKFSNLDNMVQAANRSMVFNQWGTIGGGDPNPFFEFRLNATDWRMRVTSDGIELPVDKEIHWGSAADINIGGKIARNGNALELHGVDTMGSALGTVAMYPDGATAGFVVDANVTAGETNVQLWVGGTLVRATVGAADSGGTGFRQLIVPN